MPINPEDIIIDKPKGEKGGLNPANIEPDSSRSWKFGSEMLETMKNIGKVYPAFETAATMATAIYGVPISGLIGLAALPFGADAANSTIEATQKFLVYKAQTEGGQKLTEAASVPNKLLAEAGQWVGSKAKDPLTASISDALVQASPALLGLPKAPKIGNVGLSKIVEQGINKGVRPSVIKKEVLGQRERYMQNAQIAVDEIIKNKENLKMLDREGNPIEGKLPSTLDEFSQAINKTKNDIFSNYDELSKTADARGAGVNMGPVIAELDNISSDRVLSTLSPDTIRYAAIRKAALTEDAPMGQPKAPKEFSTQEAQRMTQMLNQSEKAYYANPTPEMKGRAYVDALIANNLRAGLDAAIEGATGVEYAPLKMEYGALRMLETDVTKRAIVDARKSVVGLIDLSDIFSSSQLVQGLIAQQPAILASGVAVKGASMYYKHISNPNTIVRKMFEKYEKYGKVESEQTMRITPQHIVGTQSGIIKEEEQLGQ